MATTSGFFGNRRNPVLPAVHSHQAVKKGQFVNVGGSGDCGFRSVAAAMMSNVLFNPRANRNQARKLLEIRARYFEPYPTHGRSLSTPGEQLATLLKKLPDRARFLSEMAYALRQVAVDEMCAHRDEYHGVFTHINEGTSPASMRRQETYIDESALAALSDALAIPIKVEIVRAGKPLFGSLPYNGQLDKPPADPVVIRLEIDREHYIPWVHEPDYFKGMTQSVMIKPLAPHPVDQVDPEELARIAAVDNRLYEDYNQNVERLNTMLELGELDKDRLLGVYIAGQGRSDYLDGRIKYVGLEWGNQAFFEALKNRRSSQPAGPDGTDWGKQVTRELVHAIARAISIGQLSPDSVYEKQDKPSLGFHS